MYAIEKKGKSMKSYNVKKREANSEKCKFWGSVRMVFMISAFLAQVFHTWLRNTMNFLVLCMVKKNNEHFSNKTMSINPSTDLCGTKQDGIVQSLFHKAGDLEWSRDEELLMLSSLYYGYVAVMPIGGYLCDKFGGKLFFVHCLTIQSVLFMLTPPILRWSFKAGFVLRVLQGIVSGIGTPSIYQLFSVWSHPSEMTSVMSFAFGGFSIGTILAYPVSGHLCHLGWEVSFYVVGFFIFVVSASFHWLVYDSLDDHPRLTEKEYIYLKNSSTKKVKSKIPWKCILKSVPVHAFNLTHIFHSYGIIIVTIILPKMLKETMHFSVTETSYYSIFPFLGGALSKLVTSSFAPIERKFQHNLTTFKRSVYIICNILTIICLFGIIYSTCALKYVIVTLIFIFGFVTDVAFSATYWPSLIFVAPSFSGVIIGIANCFANLTGVIAPMITAEIVKEGSKSEWNIILYSIIISYVLAGLVYGFFGSTKLAPWGKVVTDDENIKMKEVNKNQNTVNNL